MKIFNCFLIMIACTLTSSAHAAQAHGAMLTEVKDHVQDFTNTGDITIENGIGQVNIEGWSRNVLHIQTIKRAATQAILDATLVDIKTDEQTATIKTIHRQRQGFASGTQFDFNGIQGDNSVFVSNGSFVMRGDGMSAGGAQLVTITSAAVVDYFIHAPHLASVTVNSGSGPITIKKLLGGIITKSGSGATKIKGSVNAEARSGSGRIKISNAGGKANAHTGSGNIVVKGNLNHVYARTIGGNITVKRAKVVDAQTQSGFKKITLPEQESSDGSSSDSPSSSLSQQKIKISFGN